MVSWLKGIIPPLVIPFDEQGKIDPSALKAEVEFQIAAGATAVCVGGSTGEGAGLKSDELSELCSMCVEHTRGRLPVILYNVIPRAQVSAGAIGKLIDADAIDGVKQSGANLHLLADLLYLYGNKVQF